MRALLLTKYGPKAASVRHRFLQFVPHLQASGIDVTVSTLLDDRYLERRFESGDSDLGTVARGFARRVRTLLDARTFDVAVIQYELFPYIPINFERLLKWCRIPYIVDFDDAIFHTYDQHRLSAVRWMLGRRIAHVMADAAMVVAGNEYLAAYARQANRRVEILPTVLDLERYPARRVPGARDNLTICWIGSPSTAPFVRERADALGDFFNARRGRLLLVGSGPMVFNDLPVDVHAWSAATEAAELAACDIGIMPMPDIPWTRGKCGFKLLQYWAAGLPVVASPVGVNTTLVQHGVNGFLATTRAEWLTALNALADDRTLRIEMGLAGRLKVERDYSLQSAAQRFVALLVEAACMERARRPRTRRGRLKSDDAASPAPEPVRRAQS